MFTPEDTKKLLDDLRVVLYKLVDLVDATVTATPMPWDNEYANKVRDVVYRIDNFLKTDSFIVIYALTWLLNRLPIGTKVEAEPTQEATSKQLSQLQLLYEFLSKNKG